LLRQVFIGKIDIGFEPRQNPREIGAPGLEPPAERPGGVANA
jgi:hypothetical protein